MSDKGRIFYHSGQHMCILYVYTMRGGSKMATAKVFKSGNSQAVRLPKAFRVKSKEVEISRRGEGIGVGGRAGAKGRGVVFFAAPSAGLRRGGGQNEKSAKRGAGGGGWYWGRMRSGSVGGWGG